MTKFCPSCGKELQFENAEICPNCGVRISSPPLPQSEIKSPGIAAIASFVVPGLGQIYCGQIGRGIMIIDWLFYRLCIDLNSHWNDYCSYYLVMEYL